MTDRYSTKNIYRQDTTESAFDREIAPSLLAMEENRLAVCATSRLRWAIGIFLILGIAGGGMYVTEQNDWSLSWIVVIVVLVGIALWYWGQHPRSNFTAEQRETVLCAVCNHLGNMSYSNYCNETDFGIDAFSEAKIIPGFTSAYLEDLVEGTHRESRFALVEATLSRKIGKNTATVFEGLLLRISLPRGVSEPITIARDRSAWGSIGSSVFGWFIPGDPVAIPHAGFEAKYDVYSKDASGALAIITPEFVKNFLAFPNVLKSDKILAAFVEDMLLLAVADTPPFLDDFSVSKPVSELRGSFEKVVDETQVIHRVIDQLLEGDRYAKR